MVLLLGIVILAHPTFRSKCHDEFEKAHRFAGWTSVALVWCQVRFKQAVGVVGHLMKVLQVILLTNDYRSPDVSLGKSLIHAPPFWMLLVMTGEHSRPNQDGRKLRSDDTHRFHHPSLDQAAQGPSPSRSIVQPRCATAFRLWQAPHLY